MNNTNGGNCISSMVNVLRKTFERVDVPISPDTAFFDISSKEWRGDYETNRLFLLLAQQRANDELRQNGVVDLDEIYKRLDIKPRYSKSGRRLGWIREGDEDDTYVDFGLYNVDFMNGAGVHYWPNGEPFIMLNFNAYDISE